MLPTKLTVEDGEVYIGIVYNPEYNDYFVYLNDRHGEPYRATDALDIIGILAFIRTVRARSG